MARARYVHIVDEVPELTDSDELVMVVALDGFLDAGNAAALVVQHLTEQDAGGVVASFEVDEFHDYRARRPAISFVKDRYQDYDAPRLVVRLMRDELATPYLLLAGPEPDLRWEAFVRGVIAVTDHFNVQRTLSLGSVPMAIPHTRPLRLTAHTNTDEFPVPDNPWEAELRIPSSAQSLLELRLGEHGHPAGGFVAHIPHYVAQYDYPLAAQALLQAVGEEAGLFFDTTELGQAGEQRRADIDSQVADSSEVQQLVSGLEQQYDAFHQSGKNLLIEPDLTGDELPSGDELGAQIEEFLAGLDHGPGGEDEA